MNETVHPLLTGIESPADLKLLKHPQLRDLAAEIREELIEVISQNGGHLAPNMGAVELSIALHYVFNLPEDKLVWDVGHQAYVHKLLTGRREFFQTLRQTEGCLGFLSRQESEYDTFGAGHAGTAISAALGMAVARDKREGKEKIVAVVGDGSLNCGVSLEGLNNVADATQDLIIILNDNKMSISPNVGSMARYLNRIISGRGYNRFKAFVRNLVLKIPFVGDDITRQVSRIEEATKSMLVPGVIFEELGIRYIGPINGHNLENLVYTLNGVKEFDEPVIVHVLTEKGRGYQLAEAEPEKFHGLACFDPDTGKAVKASNGPSFSQAFGKAACELAEENKNVVAITAAMCYGTGLGEFAERFPDRFYDVGIAEEHAVVFAAGLAVEGIRPVVAIYATFLQRSLDYVFHDICLQQLPVIICTDRSGVVEDGPTHHGIHDFSFLRNLPHLSILAPRSDFELRSMLFAAYKEKVPVIIRYPRASAPQQEKLDSEISWGKAEVLMTGKDLAIWAVGRECETALQVADILAGKKLTATVINTRFLKPFDVDLLLKQADQMPIASIEDCQIQGGLGSIIDELLINAPHREIRHYGWGTDVIPHGEVADLRQKAGLTPEAIAEDLLKKLGA